MTNILASFGQAFGRQIEYNQQQEVRDAELAGQRAMTARREQETTQAKQQQAASEQAAAQRKRLGALVGAELANSKADVTDPVEMAKIYRKGEVAALKDGDFEGAQLLEKLSDKSLGEAKEAATLKQRELVVRNEELATAALDYGEAPTVEGAKRVAQAAVAAGVNPVDIPPPNTPEFAAWTKTRVRAGETSKERVKAAERTADGKEKAEEKKREFQEREERLRQNAAQTAALREQSLALRKVLASSTSHERSLREQKLALDIEAKHDKRDAAAEIAADTKLHGPPLSVSERKDVAAVVGAAAEGTRGLRIIASMPPSQTAGAFSGMHNQDGILGSLSKVGANLVTKQSAQIYETVAAGMGLEIGRVLTLGGGRGINQSQIAEFQKMTQVTPGETEFTAMFKLANAGDVIRNRLSTLREHPDPKVRAQQLETERQLDLLPTPEQVLAAAQKSGARGSKDIAKYKTMMDAAAKLKSTTASPAPFATTGGAGTAAPTAPGGASVSNW